MKLADIVDGAGSALGMRRGEYIKVFSLFFYLFFIVTSYVVSKSLRDALYLSKFGATNLPYVYIGIAVLAGIFVSFYLKIAERFKQHVLLSLTTLFFSANAVLFWSLFKYHFSWLYPVIYIWAGIFGVIGPMQVWTLASFILTTREAKRLYGFIGSGGILGGIAGGFFSSLMVPLIGTENLLLAIAGFLLLCIPLINLIYYRSEREVTAREREIEQTTTRRAGNAGNLKQSWATISHCRYLFLIAAIISLGSIVTTIVDWQFKAVAQESINSKDQLTVFFGNFYGYLGTAAFFFQIFFTSRIMRRFGIGFTLLLLPIGLILGSTALIVYMSLATAILLKGPDQLFKHSIDRSTIELLYLPVPAEVKAKVKSFIDTIIWRLADGIAGIILLVLTTFLTLSTRQVSFVNLGIIAGWLVVAFILKREYVSSLRAAIDRQDVDAEKLTIDINDPATIESFIAALNSQETREIIYVLDLMDYVDEKRDFVRQFERLLHHNSPEVRAKALNLLNEVGNRNLAKKVKSLLHDTNPKVQAEAINFVRAHEDVAPVEMMRPLLESSSYNVKAAAICCILNSSDFNYHAEAQAVLLKMIKSNDETARREAASVLGEIHKTSSLRHYLIQLLQDNSAMVVSQALQSAGKIAQNGTDKIGAEEFLPYIINQLARKNTRAAAREALIMYGVEILPILDQYLTDQDVDISIRRTLPQAISRIGSQFAVEILIDCLNSDDLQLRLMATKGLNKLRAANIAEIDWSAQSSQLNMQLRYDVREYYSTLALLAAYNGPADEANDADDDNEDDNSSNDEASAPHRLLQDCLKRKEELLLEKIFRLLGLIYAADDLYNAYYGLSSSDITVRANAIELLDNLFTSEHQRLIIPIIDEEIPLAEKLAIGAEIEAVNAGDRIEALRHLLNDLDPLIVTCAIDAIGEARLEALYDEIESARRHDNELVRETAEKVWRELESPSLPDWVNAELTDLTDFDLEELANLSNDERGH